MAEFVYAVHLSEDGTFTKDRFERKVLKEFTTSIKVDSSSADTAEPRAITAYDAIEFIRDYEVKTIRPGPAYTHKNYILHLKAWVEFENQVVDAKKEYKPCTTATIGDGEEVSEIFITTRHTYEHIYAFVDEKGE